MTQKYIYHDIYHYYIQHILGHTAKPYSYLGNKKVIFISTFKLPIT